jgi:ATP-dependent DNA helicase RecQ
MISAGALAGWLDQQGAGCWWSMLRDAIAELASEHGDGEFLAKDLLEWLAEWGRDFRRKQTGLMLLTAHRAKGIEFDHVAVLDGGWENRSRGEDRDAARRLYYVAMTRAKLGLTLLSKSGARHPMLAAANDRAFLIRRANGRVPDPSSCMMRYQILNLSQVDLSFAGRLRDGNPSLEAIGRLRTGDPVFLTRSGDRWLIGDSAGTPVGRLAQSYTPPPGTEFVRGEAEAVLVRRREDSGVEYQAHLQRDRWDVVVPELVFRPKP